MPLPHVAPEVASRAVLPPALTGTAPSPASCEVNGRPWPVCTSAKTGWAYENGAYCIARSFCPSGRSALPTTTVREHPVDPHADRPTRQLYRYLRSIWGKSIIAGQQDLTWNDSVDMAARVHADTGKYPALMGFDFMNYGMKGPQVQGLSQTEEAIAFARKGGMVAFAWHWRDPALLGTDQANHANFYVQDQDARKNTGFMIPVAQGQLDRNNAAYAHINAGIDLVAGELKRLGAAGVPVLWRPLHEASGFKGNGWFWWGRARSDGVPQAYAHILLWRHLYERLVHHHGLHNLIWVWNGQDPAWYPGDDVVDIVSQDIYDQADHQAYRSQIDSYLAARRMSDQNKMIALSENSYIPDPDKIVADGAWWLWFMVWNDGKAAEGVTDPGNFWTGEYYNTAQHKKKVYQHPRVITLDKLDAGLTSSRP